MLRGLSRWSSWQGEADQHDFNRLEAVSAFNAFEIDTIAKIATFANALSPPLEECTLDPIASSGGHDGRPLKAFLDPHDGQLQTGNQYVDIYEGHGRSNRARR